MGPRHHFFINILSEHEKSFQKPQRLAQLQNQDGCAPETIIVNLFKKLDIIIISRLGGALNLSKNRLSFQNHVSKKCNVDLETVDVQLSRKYARYLLEYWYYSAMFALHCSRIERF